MTSSPPARCAALAAALLSSLLGSRALAETYDVGDAEPYARIGDVPWESLGPGDVVQIHWRAEPYREKWVIGRRGTEAAPIVVRGIPGPGGELPVILGEDATTRRALDYWNENRGVIKIGGSSVPSEALPAWIVIEGLDVRSARPPYGFTDDQGSPATYAENAAAIYVEVGEHIVIRGCEIHDSGNGIFVGAHGGETRDIRIEGNHVYDNGIEGSIYEHNSYTAALGIVFERNHYGPLLALGLLARRRLA